MATRSVFLPGELYGQDQHTRCAEQGLACGGRSVEACCCLRFCLCHDPTLTPEFYYYPEGERRFQHSLFGSNYYKNDFIVTPQPVETYPWTG